MSQDQRTGLMAGQMVGTLAGEARRSTGVPKSEFHTDERLDVVLVNSNEINSKLRELTEMTFVKMDHIFGSVQQDPISLSEKEKAEECWIERLISHQQNSIESLKQLLERMSQV